jgi:hypothetical protein
VQRITEEIEASCEIRVNEIKEHLHATERRLFLSTEATKQAQEATERCQSQLLMISSQSDGTVSSLQNENSLLVETIDRLRSHIAELENDLSIMKTSSNQSPASSSSTPSASRSLSLIGAGGRGHGSGGGGGHGNSTPGMMNSYEMAQDKLHSYNEIISQLKHELLLKDEQILKEKNKSEKIQIESLKEIENLKCEKNNLLSELKLRPERKEFNELKKQLKVIQNVLFHTEEEEGEGEDGEGEEGTGEEYEGMTGGGGGGEGMEGGRNENDMKEINSFVPSHLQSQQSQQSPHLSAKAHRFPGGGLMKLESMLVTRLKTLEHELTENRVSLETLRHREEIAQKRVIELEHSLDDAQTLITQLEKDLENHVMTTASATTGSSSGGGGRRGGGTAVKKKDKENQSAAADPSLVQLLTDSNDSYTPSAGQKSAGSENQVHAGSVPGASCGQQQMISILQAQRDRYKERLENVISSSLLPSPPMTPPSLLSSVQCADGILKTGHSK